MVEARRVDKCTAPLLTPGRSGFRTLPSLYYWESLFEDRSLKPDPAQHSTLRIGYDGLLVRRQRFGVGRYIRELACALQRVESLDLRVYAADPEPWSMLERTQAASSHLARVPNYARSRGPRIMWQQLRLPARATLDEIDVFHATGYIMPLRLRVPCVLTIYDLLSITHPELCRMETRLHYGRLMKRSLQLARRISVPSSRVRDEVLSHFDVEAGRVSVVPPGINEVFSRAATTDELEAVRDHHGLTERFVLFAGDREPKKNLARLFAAFTQAREAGLEGELILVGGTGWGRDRSLPMPEGVRRLGYVSDAELALLYQAASEFVFPSLAEGFGLPVIEAMASGTVVIASPVAAVMESSPKAALLVDPTDVASISKNLLRARRDPDLRAQLIESGTQAAAKFSWESAAEQTAELYRSALAE